MRIHKTESVLAFRGKKEILAKQKQYVKALECAENSKTQFTKSVWQDVASIYWNQLKDLINEYDFMSMFKKLS